MKKLASLAMAGLLAAVAPGMASEGQRPAKDVSFHHEGPFGTFDRQQLQRGYKVYKNVCSNCHSLRFISFRNLSEAGIFTEEEVKALAASVTVPDPTTDSGDRPGLPSDRFPSPPPVTGGAVPPDLSLITKSRAGWYGTINQFLNGIGGPQYVYSVLTGFEPTPEDLKNEQPPGKYYNPYFASGHWIGMTPPLTDGLVEFDDGSANTVSDMAKDVSAFLAWTAEPKMEERKQMGFDVMIYLAVLTVLLYLVKKKIWADQH